MNNLLSSLAQLMTSERLDYIAHADRSEDVAEHRAAIMTLCRTGAVPRQFDWVPLEVLELTRWVDPCDTEVDWGLATHELHIVRAFCCTALLMQPDGSDPGIDSTLGNLGASLLALGREYMAQLPPVLEHVLRDPDLDETEIAFTHALRLWLALEFGENIDKILEDVLSAETKARALSQSCTIRSISFADTDHVISVHGWHALGQRICDLSSTLNNPEQTYFVNEIGLLLLALRRH